MKEIEQVAKQAGAHQFISELENGYQTQVGENGVLLSGGQRQRISFARALMTEPGILLLDEPTSMIDKKARESFKQSFKEVLQNKTVIMVSHEPSMANVADQVFTIENGQLIAVPNVKEDITQ
jgi:ABC-type bacteriocin/lantibiotic exporter with double-glycine peptidase domain